jgi:tRNA(fMet)-specific endonuclease VapC
MHLTIMYLLDTDHLTILQRGGVESTALRTRLAAVRPDQIATTIVSYEEQTRGWMSYMAQARTLDKQVAAYARLQQHLTNFCAIPLAAFDDEAARMFRQLQQARVRIGTMDLKIAAIALVQGAMLLSRNLADFGQVSNLQVEDWTV